jgi:hypothetical protein
LPPEIYLGSASVTQFNVEDLADARELDTNLLEEERNMALANVKQYQEFLKRHYSKKKVVPRILEVGSSSATTAKKSGTQDT